MEGQEARGGRALARVLSGGEGEGYACGKWFCVERPGLSVQVLTLGVEEGEARSSGALARVLFRRKDCTRENTLGVIQSFVFSMNQSFVFSLIQSFVFSLISFFCCVYGSGLEPAV